MKSLLLFSSLLMLSGVSAQAQEDFSIGMVTDVGGIDDKSFNQGAWEGMQRWGEEHDKEQGLDSFSYFQSDTEADYITNLNLAAQNNLDIVFAIGYKLQPAVQETAEQYPEQYFGMVDSVVDLPNVASLNFADEEAAFLAGVAAATTTQTNKVGFVGGVEGVVIDKFEAGFVAGVQAVDESIDIEIQYAGSFTDPSIGRTIAATMYSNDIDVIFHASGPTGNGVFSEAKDLVSIDPNRDLWVIGVDLDQSAEGELEIDGETRNINLTSTLKNTGNAIHSFSNTMMEEGFEPGIQWFNLANDGVGIAEGRLTDESLEIIEGYKQQIIDGDIEVPDAPE
ncbi:BMP family ABC transporter substrate-binding protein [Aerococcaceae bacterium INB8]|uniref:BMP family ABC transporter substrate-binding protein n=1 Tax=Ruoffia halotolerans TaxID=2748684 RepID=A0A839A8Y7_9LACT|nr:BMP family ABC transporter substrate-binding protein [Ruoffia halotolerans]MBA5730168.1 BMP family ABC transporter substrate-binding protein [Ruoffia halotolerans]